jgi:DNA primase
MARTQGRAEQRTETPVEVEGRRITLVNLEKVMYPRTGTTKAEVLNYYAQGGDPHPLAARHR